MPMAASAAVGIRTIPDEWDRLRVDYDLARSRHERFAALVHQACVARYPMKEIHQLESHAGELYARRIDALFALVASPVPTLGALRIAFRHLYDDLIRCEDHEHLVGSILADFERLSG